MTGRASQIVSLFTYFFHFNEESVSVVPGVVEVNVLLMALYLLADEVSKAFVFFE